MKKIWIFIILSSLLFAKSSLDNNQIIRDFSGFDRVYIPTLYFTSIGKLEKAKDSMKTLRIRWDAFSEKYKMANPEDIRWVDSFKWIESNMMQVEQIVKSSGDLNEAHELLEGINNVFVSLRKRNNISYYPDRLTEFHRPMDLMVSGLKGIIPENVSKKDRELVSNNIQVASVLWNEIEVTEFDNSLFGLQSEQLEMMRKYIAEEKNNLRQVKSALQQDNAKLLKTVSSLKQGFAKVYLMFGEF